MTTVPFMSTAPSAPRIASTARASAASLLPRPCSVAAARAPASVTRRSSRARLRLIFGSSIIGPSVYEAAASSADPAPADRQLVRFDPEVDLARQAAVAIPVDIDAGTFEHCGDPHLGALQHGVESVDEHLILVELHVAEAARAAGPPLGREPEPRWHRGTGLDGEARAGRPGKPDRGSRRSG